MRQTQDESMSSTPQRSLNVRPAARSLDEGWSPWSERRRARLLLLPALALLLGAPFAASPAEAQPARPKWLRVVPDDQSLRVSWAPADGVGANVTGWDVHYTSSLSVAENAAVGSNVSSAWVDASHTGRAYSHYIEDLTAGTGYRVRVRAVTANGNGAWAFAGKTDEGCGIRMRDCLFTPRIRDVGATVSAAPNPVDEGSRTTVTVTLAQEWPADWDVVIPLTATSGTAESDDWDIQVPNVIIPKGSRTGTTYIQTRQDADQDAETVTVMLDTANLPPGVAEGTPPSVLVTITDTGAYHTGDVVVAASAFVSLSASPNPVDEGSPVMVTATLSSALSSDVTIPLTVTPDTAEAGDHGTLAGITIPAGGLSASGTITTTADDDADDERFTVALGALPSGVGLGRPSSVYVEITDDDPEPQGGGNDPEPQEPLTAAFEDVPEEHDGEGRFVVRVRFSEALGTAGSGPSRKSFDVRGGRVNNVKRLGDGLWRVRVKPDSWRDVTVTLAGGRACGEAGAVCTADGRALSNSIEASVGGPVRIRIKGGDAREGKDAGIDFAVTLNRASSETVSVDYATADVTAKAGEDYTAVSGTLRFAAGETAKTLHVPILDDDVDEGHEGFEMRLSNASAGFLRGLHKAATGTIRNTDRIPAALLARFGRATAEQVVTHIEERMAAPRRRGFRARFAGREFRPGQERDFALGLVSQFAQPMGMGPAGAAPMGMGPHAAGAGAFGVGTGGMGGAMSMSGMGGMSDAMGMAGQHAPMGGYGSAVGAYGGGLLGSMGMGGDLFSNSEFELNRESRGGILSVWSRSSRSHFSGLEDALSLNGDVRTTMFGADYSRGALTVGLSVGRTLGLGGYRGTSGGQMSTSMTGVYPWVGYQVNDRVSVWGTTGYGTGALSLTPDAASAMETGVSMMMSAVGTRGELIGSRATGGFALAFKADALWVGAASELLDGPAGRLNASEAGVTRVRTALEGSRGFTLGGGRLSLTPSVEVGLRRDGGDAETGAGMDVGGGLAFTDTVTGLSLDVRVRTLVVHQADGFTERGMSLSLGWDPTPSSPLGLTARVAPSWGGQSRGGAEALWGGQMAYGMGSHQMYGSGDRVDAEVGYGLPVGARFVGTPRVGMATSQYGRDYRVGYGLGVLDRDDVNFELGVDAQRRESPMEGGASNGFMGRATLGW